MSTGTVKWFNEKKGYGFITPDDGGKDLFVHYTAIEAVGFRTLREGQRVDYEAVEGEKGPQARNVRPAEE
ncbi:MAG: cold-shock protein [Candidatus Sumerlaeia bacterium]